MKQLINNFIKISFIPLMSIGFISCGASDNKTLIVGTLAAFDKATYSNYNFSVYSRTLSNLTPIYLNSSNSYEGLLCDYTSVVENGKLNVNFTIKDNYKWSDGNKVTADDFIFTIDYLNKQDATFTLNTLLDSYTKVNDNKVNVVFNNSNYLNLSNFTSFTLLPKHIFKGKTYSEVTSDTSLGNGPYHFVSKDESNDTLVFEKNDYSPLKGKYNKIIFKTYLNSDTLYSALKSQEIDVVYNYSSSVSQDIADTFKDNDKFVVNYHDITANPFILFFNGNNAKVQDLNLRKAISYAIDYDSFKSIHGSESANVGNKGIIAPGNVGYKETEKNSYSLSKANEFMESAGYYKNASGFYEKDGGELNLTIASRNDAKGIKFTRAAETIKNNLETFGIHITLDPKATTLEFQEATGKKNTTYEMAISSATAAGVNFDHGLLTRYFYGPLSHAAQIGNINDETYINLISNLDSATTYENYISYCGQVQDFYASNVPGIALMYDTFISVYSKNYELNNFDTQLGVLNVKNLVE